MFSIDCSYFVSLICFFIVIDATAAVLAKACVAPLIRWYRFELVFVGSVGISDVVKCPLNLGI